MTSTNTGLASIALQRNGIIEIRFIPEYEIQVEDIVEIQNGILSLSSSPAKILVVPGKSGSISKEARDKDMFENHPAPEMLSVAIVSTLLHHRILGSMYFKYVNKKYYRHRFFKNETEARTWLLNQ